MSFLLPCDERPVTLTWTTTVTEEHRARVPFGELRAAIDSHRNLAGVPHHPDYAADLDLLTESWLGDYEQDGGSPVDFDRAITGHDLPELAHLSVFTVSLDDAEPGEARECPHTYVLHAPDLETASALAIAHHRESFPADYPPDAAGPELLDGPWWTFPGAPSWPADLTGRTWSDLRADAAVIERAHRIAAAR